MVARAPRLLTVFSLPKPFAGHIGSIQWNAVESWTRLHADVQVILLGEGEDEARELGAEFADVARNDEGTPLLSDAFAQAEARRRHELLCFVNADILLAPQLVAAAEAVSRRSARFLVVGESWNVRVDGPIAFDPGWERRLVARGRKRGADAIDYFAFRAGLYDDVPPFAIGRMAFDNWLVWRARAGGAMVVDATRVVPAIHQDHAYDHVPGGLTALRRSSEARSNRDLAGGKSRLYSRFDATHVLTPTGLRRNLGSVLRWKEKSRRAIYKVRHRIRGA